MLGTIQRLEKTKNLIIKTLNTYLKDNYVLIHPKLGYILYYENMKEFSKLNGLLLASTDTETLDYIESIYLVIPKLYVERLDKDTIMNLEGDIRDYGAIKPCIEN